MGEFKNLSGLKFAKLLVLDSYVSKEKYPGCKRKGVYWDCVCDCGNKASILAYNITAGVTKSCGCLIKSGLSGNFKHGQAETRLFKIWTGMLNRCSNKNNRSYPRYGGRGISVCEFCQKDYMNFYEWANKNGYSDSLTIDRINNELDYSPDNCKWADIVVQSNNRRNNTYLEHNGERKTIADWARFTGFKYGTFLSKLKRGSSLEQILERANITV